MTAGHLSTSPLDQKLLQLVPPLNSEVRRSILSSVWDLQLSKDDYSTKFQQWDAYFRHYEEQCEQLSPGGVSTLTHRQILEIVELLKTQTRAACSNELLHVLPPQLHSLVGDAIAFAANALMLLNVSRWKGDQSLKTFVSSHFTALSAASEKYKLPRSFNLQTLDKVAGIKVHWTTDITQHLSMKHDDTEVALFHHVAVLDLYRLSKT
jgi:hypothetical protein